MDGVKLNAITDTAMGSFFLRVAQWPRGPKKKKELLLFDNNVEIICFIVNFVFCFIIS